MFPVFRGENLDWSVPKKIGTVRGRNDELFGKTGKIPRACSSWPAVRQGSAPTRRAGWDLEDVLFLPVEPA
jgi:hypothetical protein